MHNNFRFSSAEVWVKALGLLNIVLLAAALQVHAQVNVVTYHNDIARTGLNPNETLLTPASVN